MAGIAAAATEGNPNIFFIIGAPTNLTFHEFKEFCGDEDGEAKKPNVKLAICADIDTHKKSLACENVFKTPTNFRAHGDDIGHAFLTMDGDTKVEKSLNTLDDFKKLQEDTAESIYDILKYAKVNGIHTYFASVPRELRPILLHREQGDIEEQKKMIEDKFGEVSEDGSIKLNKDGKRLNDLLKQIHGEVFERIYSKYEEGKRVYPHIISGDYILKNADFELIELILKKLEGKVIYNLRENINNRDITKYGATFLADVITVGCALLIRDEYKTAWKHYDIIFGEDKDKGEEKTKTKIYWGNSKFKFAKAECKCAGVQQENISYKENANGFFHGFDAKNALATLTDKMKEALEQENIWENCYVWHDDKLNDVDDEPAITLIEQLSSKVEKCKSYKPVGSAGSSTGGYKKSYGKKKKTKKTRRKTKNMRKKSKSKTKKKSTRKKKHYKKRKSKTHKKR